MNKGPDMVQKDHKDNQIKYKVEIDMLEKFDLIEVNDINYENGFKYLILN